MYFWPDSPIHLRIPVMAKERLQGLIQKPLYRPQSFGFSGNSFGNSMFPATLRRNGEYSSPIRFAFNRSCSLFPILQFLVCFAVDYNFGAYSVWLQFNFNERMGTQGREMDEVGDGNTAGRNGNLVNIELTHYFQGFFEVKTGGNVIYISSLVWGAGSTGFQNIGLWRQLRELR